MARGKKELVSAVRASIVLEKAQWEHVKRIAIQMSVEKGRQVTPTEALRLAINNYFPMNDQLIEQKNWDKNEEIKPELVARAIADLLI